MSPPFPARLHVLLARDAPIGVGFRRGPSRSVCTVLWDRRTDTFTVGPWLKGRIDERRSDLSPDGKHLILFALSGVWTATTGRTWTAISRAPWLKALVLLGKGDTYGGGGLFTGLRTYWLNNGHADKPLLDSTEVTRDTDYAPQHFNNECPGVYYPRLMRDGWALTEQRRISAWDAHATFEKALPNGWILRKTAHEQVTSLVGTAEGRGCYWDDHTVEHRNSGRTIDGSTWEWAEVDGKSLVWATGGALFRAPLPTRHPFAEPVCVHDFNDMTFQRLQAPY